MPNNKIFPVLEMKNICKGFAKPSGEALPVLSDISLTLQKGEILGLLGRSGSGKSTFLRITAGLISASSGEVRYCGKLLNGPEEGISVVFQTFALFPWLTVYENVQLGLDSLHLGTSEVHERVMSAIDLIGLDGFQSAYPRELSGGMRQRVGLARALVIHPTLLLMDEPFSALDVLTAEILRSDLMDLWTGHQLPPMSVLLVTHNIEEAVLMCDRIIILSSNPGRITAEIPVRLPHPRSRMDTRFQDVVDEIYSILTSRTTELIHAQIQTHGERVEPLPGVSTNLIEGFVETLANSPYNGKAELSELANELTLEIDDLFPIAETLYILKFADLREGEIKLTENGLLFAKGGTEERKKLFKYHLLEYLPLASHIKHVLDEREDHRAPRIRFQSELEDYMTQGRAERTLNAVIAWARYAELFSYDDNSRTFSIIPVSAHKA
ncbi:MAG: nitrate/sulfonate/bicarbonate ABC transporter ATP-binding protein [Pseudomonadota bacterium]|nr:nitrate/sulfonate/bicarbonate ABC transporter ATP-binding protein [Pseudomonadota bacterium]